jgi:serine/threonine protein kinase
VKGFLREAHLLSELGHPALVAVHKAWEENDTAYMAMSYYPGKTLRELRMGESKALSEARIFAMMMPVFEATAELHAHRIIHRDISPDNILVMANGATVLLDLGAARQVLGGMTQALTTILKPGFAPIEQYVEDGSMEQGRWTDVYGLAAVMYFLSTGKPPTPATTRIVRDSLPPIAEASQGATYSASYAQAVTKALSIRAIGRYKSVAEFRDALGWTGLAVPQPTVAPNTSSLTAVTQTPHTARAALAAQSAQAAQKARPTQLATEVTATAAVLTAAQRRRLSTPADLAAQSPKKSQELIGDSAPKHAPPSTPSNLVLIGIAVALLLILALGLYLR